MPRAAVLIAIATLLVAGQSCQRSVPSAPVTVHLPQRPPEKPASPSTPPAPKVTPQADEPTSDPHRPECTDARCLKIKNFIKDNYCGESPFGNGPDDGCDIRTPKKVQAGTKISADYLCRWNNEKAKTECRQNNPPSPAFRDILIGEMRHLGLPLGSEKELFFTVLESSSGWSLMKASYEHVTGEDLIVCEVVLAVDESSKVHVLRKIPLHKRNIDAPDGTSWSPVDIADADSDGKVELILQSNAYEDHWFEVVRIDDGSFKVVFSGLGYYL